MYFSKWSTLLDIFLIGIFSYVFIVLLLRISGKRTLSKWNAFDFIITVAFGSILASTIVSNSIALSDGAAALALLVLLQFVVTWSTVRSKFLKDVVKAEPTLLFYKGNFLKEDMKKERVTESEILAAIRGNGISSLDKTGAVILETDGSFSVIQTLDDNPTALADVNNKGV